MRGSGTIALRGSVSGTLKFSRGEAALYLRGRSPRPVRAYFLSEDGGGVISGDISRDMRCAVPESGICAAAVFDASARLMCFGALGPCGGRLSEMLGEIRMRAAYELYGKAENGRSGERADNKADKPSASPGSAVTEEILARAKGLFAPLKDGETHEEPVEPPAEIRAVPNPFPRSYPNSYWQQTEGQTHITGTAQTMRGRILLRAMPGRRGRRPMGYERFLISSDGRGYWVHEQR